MCCFFNLKTYLVFNLVLLCSGSTLNDEGQNSATNVASNQQEHKIVGDALINNDEEIIEPPRESEITSSSTAEPNRLKRNENFKFPLLNFDNTFLTSDEITELNNEKIGKPRVVNKFYKYPYYNKFIDDDIMKNSPLRYAENMDYIPRKTEGGSEFYDSKISKECAEVIADIDPIPDRIKNRKPDSEEDEREKRETSELKKLVRKRREFDQNAAQPRLRGLGDNIDCFKEKYFGFNPLDSPFFDEETITPPEPLQLPFGIGARVSNHNPIIFPSYEASQSRHFPVNVFPRHSKINSNKPRKTIRQTENTILQKKTQKPKEQNFPASPLLTGEVIQGSVKSKISLPDTLFNKYLKGSDPQMNVYGDVIGNIMFNLQRDEIQSINSLAENSNNDPLHEMLGRNNYLNNQYPDYEYRKNIISPKGYVKLHHKVENARNLIPLYQSNKIRLVSVRNKRNVKVYKDIGREERKVTPIPETESNLRENSTNNVQLDTISNGSNQQITEVNPSVDNKPEVDPHVLRNHRRFYAPITTIKSISPEQLHMEYIIRAAEESGKLPDNTSSPVISNESQNTNSESKSNLNTTEVLVQPETVINKVNDRVSNFYKQNEKVNGYQNEKDRQKGTIFDVSAFLPRPVYLSSVQLRHNISSKYNAEIDSSPEKSQISLNITQLPDNHTAILDYDSEDSEDETSTTAQNYVTNETIRHTVDTHPNATITPILLESYYSTEAEVEQTTESNYDDESSKEYVSPEIEWRNVLSYIRNTPEEPYDYVTPRNYYSTPRYRETTRQEDSTYASRQINRDNAAITSTEPLAVYNKKNRKVRRRKEKYTYSNDDEITEKEPIETTTTQKAPVLRVKNRAKRPKRIRRPTTPYTEKADYDSPEQTTQKPAMLEKMSKKRKTTVITNSKRYRNDEKPEVEYEKREILEIVPEIDKPTHPPPGVRGYVRERERKKILNQNHKEYTTSPESPTPDTLGKESYLHGSSQRPQARNRQHTPFTEESVYEEDYEEEVIKERTTPVTTDEKYYHGPQLAKKVNNLSEARIDVIYPIDYDYEDYRETERPRIVPNQRISGKKRTITRTTKKSHNPKLKVFPSVDSLSESSFRKQGSGALPHIEDKGMSARVLRSFASLLAMTTTTPKPIFEKDPSKRMYYYLQVK